MTGREGGKVKVKDTGVYGLEWLEKRSHRPLVDCRELQGMLDVLGVPGSERHKDLGIGLAY